MTRLSDHDLDQRYREFLDECFGLVQICGYQYDASGAFHAVDPIAYNCGFSDWLDSELGETLWEHPEGGYCDEDPSAEEDAP